jgi:ABC-2 type transport system permease protein
MLHSVFTKAVRDRLVATLVAAVSVGALTVFSMVVYRDVDVSLYQNLPPALRELMGIPDAAGVAALAYGAMYDFIGVLVFAGLAISMGASAVAGEEQDGTMGLLLSNPVSRRGIVISKSMAMVALIGLGALLLWALGVLAPRWSGVSVEGLDPGAMTLALGVNALVYGFLALAIGAATGNRGAASGVAITVMIVGYLAESLLPLTENLGWVAEIFPWHYYNSSRPLINGIDWGQLAVLIGIVVVSFVGALVGVASRDLKEKSVGVTLADRLRANRRTRKIMERIAGGARVSRISVKTMSDFQGLLVVTGMVVFYLGLIVGPLYGFVPQDLVDFFAQLPDVLIAMVGGANMATPEGFYQAEMFSITGPVAVIVLTASMGAKAIAGEEENGTMGLLLSNPVTRGHVISEKTVAMTIHALTLGVAMFLGCWLGARLGSLDISAGGLAAASTQLALLGLVFGGLALAVGAATGRPRFASTLTAAAAVVAYFVWTFLPLSERLEPWAVLSPFHFYLGGDPLRNGLVWDHIAVLAAMFLTLALVSVPLFSRRDLRG